MKQVVTNCLMSSLSFSAVLLHKVSDGKYFFPFAIIIPSHIIEITNSGPYKAKLKTIPGLQTFKGIYSHEL